MGQKNIELMHKQNGILLASFPRSGSTLTCQFLAKAVMSTIKSSDGLRTQDIVPNLIGEDYTRPDTLKAAPLFMRTHDAEPIGKFKTHFMFRRPDDALASYYFLVHRNKELGDKEKFCFAWSPLWKKLAVEALKKDRDSTDDINFMRYESYIEDPITNMDRLLNFVEGMNIESSQAIVTQLNSNFRQKVDIHKDERQPSRGAIGANAQILSQNVLDHIEAELMPLYRELSRKSG